jgi:hypothetical protein
MVRNYLDSGIWIEMASERALMTDLRLLDRLSRVMAISAKIHSKMARFE